MDGCRLGLGLVVEDKPTEFSCRYPSIEGEKNNFYLP